jgi:hypothetical protein
MFLIRRTARLTATAIDVLCRASSPGNPCPVDEAFAVGFPNRRCPSYGQLQMLPAIRSGLLRTGVFSFTQLSIIIVNAILIAKIFWHPV